MVALRAGQHGILPQSRLAEPSLHLLDSEQSCCFVHISAGKRGVTFNLQDQCTGLMGCLIKGLGFGGQFVSSKVCLQLHSQSCLSFSRAVRSMMVQRLCKP